MEILALIGLGEARYTSGDSLIAGLRSLGHHVIVAGPFYAYMERDRNDFGDDYIFLEDKPFPEFYTLDYVLEHVGKDRSFDFILQIEPHFYLTGPKISKIPIAHYMIDIHCGGEFYYRYLKEHQHLFDFVLIGHPQFSYFFRDLSLPLYSLPLAFDERRFAHFAHEQIHETAKPPHADISFIGHLGIRRELLEVNAKRDHIGKYVDSLPLTNGWSGLDRYEDRSPFGSYGERAEMLMRLMEHFDCRMYFERLLDHRYEQAIRAGKMGFNYSLLQDLNLHFFELGCTGVPFVTDELPPTGVRSIDSLLFYSHTVPRALFKPSHSNFTLDFNIVKKAFENILNNYEESQAKAKMIKELVWKGHRFSDRAKRLVEIAQLYSRTDS